jgi:hypothetical protein
VRRRDQGLVTTDDYLETRRRLVRAALEPKADGDGNREAADILGVDEGTIRNDLAAENSADGKNNSTKNNGGHADGVEFSLPVDTIGEILGVAEAIRRRDTSPDHELDSKADEKNNGAGELASSNDEAAKHAGENRRRFGGHRVIGPE